MMTMRRIVCPLVFGLLFSMPAFSQEHPAAASFAQRLSALQANPATADLAGLESLQAQQAIAVLAKAKKRDLEHAEYVAGRRVEIAEAAARAAAARKEVDQLDKVRAELLIEASRREAVRARAELEKMRLQAQLQAEETERLRQEAEAELLARQDAEQALVTVSGNQAARLSEAQQKAVRLAKEEAELVTGYPLPGSKFESRGEVFTMTGDAFGSGNARVSEQADNQLKALVEYLTIIGKRGRIRIEGFGAANALGEQRAQAIGEILRRHGIPANRLQMAGRKSASTRARSAEIVIAP